jgi:hypothetical protein
MAREALSTRGCSLSDHVKAAAAQVQ